MDSLLLQTASVVTAVLFLLIGFYGGFCLLILVHETGHYVMAQLLDCGVKEYVVAGGPIFLEFSYRETIFRFNSNPFNPILLPDGRLVLGYVSSKCRPEHVESWLINRGAGLAELIAALIFLLWSRLDRAVLARPGRDNLARMAVQILGVYFFMIFLIQGIFDLIAH